MFSLSLSNVGEDLGEGVAPDRGGVDQHRPPGELRLLQNLQNLQCVVQPPAGPQKVQDVALDDEYVHATLQVKVPVLSQGRRPGAQPGEEKEEGTGRAGPWRRAGTGRGGRRLSEANRVQSSGRLGVFGRTQAVVVCSREGSVIISYAAADCPGDEPPFAGSSSSSSSPEEAGTGDEPA